MATKKKLPAGLAPKYGKGRIRGLGRAQYMVLSRMVRLGQATWDELEAKGCALSPARESDFLKAVKKVIA